MITAAIICEYNPFHNGHLYQINQIKKELNADFIIAIMSGNFVQRGTPAFCDKFSRATSALECGIDLIFELPVRYSTSSAEYFSYGAVSILNALNSIDYLVFGTESGDLHLLDQYADLFYEEPVKYQKLLKKFLKEGLSYPAAREAAATQILHSDSTILLSTPNNILAIEYLKALKKCHSNIRPYTVKRSDSGYHHTNLESSISSATSIRNHMNTYGFDKALAHTVPAPTGAILKEQFLKSFPVTMDDFSDIIFYRLLTESHPETYLDYHSEIWDRIMRFMKQTASVEELILLVKAKNFTYSRISRFLLHLMLNIKKHSDFSLPAYAKLLGFRKDASSLLKHIKTASSIPVIQKTSQYQSILDEAQTILFEEDLKAASIYNYAVQKKFSTILPEDGKYPLLIV